MSHGHILIDMDAKDEVKERLAVEDVVGEYIELKRAGRNLKGLSPFTKERTPSLIVSPEKQIWTDFSSNQGGDIFSFVMMMEGIDFKAALEILARKAGVELKQYQSAGGAARAKQKVRVQEALELATKYYHASLTKNKTALDYVVKKRGYGKQIISNFNIGYAPDSGQALRSFLQKRGYKDEELKAAGLVTQRHRGFADMFRGRIMVPLSDGQGNPVGFTARVLDDSLPKYINTPQTIVYDKSRNVFGLHLAKESIREKNFSVVVEGNMDVVASHKTSVKNVVATAGTAITLDHLKQVYRISNDVRLAFDQDRAGIQATERAIPLAQSLGVRLSVIDVPEGKDPDELIAKNPKAWESAVETSVYVMDWLIERYKSLHDVSSAEGKRSFSDKVLGVLSQIPDPVEQEHYLKLVSEITNTSTAALQRKLEQVGNKQTKKLKKPRNQPVVVEKQQDSAFQDMLLGMALRYNDLERSFKDLQPKLFSGEARQAVAEYIMNTGGNESVQEVPAELQKYEDYVKLILFKTEELYDERSASDRLIAAIGLARKLIEDNQKTQKKLLSKQIRTAEEAGDTKKKQELLIKFNELLKE